MESPLLKYDLRPELPAIFDDSFTGTYGECQRMAYYGGVLGRRSKQPSFTLVWGGVFHQIAQTWIETKDAEQVIRIISDNIPEVTEDRYGRNARRMQELFIAWAEYWQANPVEILRTEQPAVVHCDSPCPYSDNGCGLVYGGRLDNISRWNALIGPHDFKTTVMEVSDPIAAFKPSHQMEGYIWLTGHLIGKHPWGVILERLLCNKSKLQIDRFPISYPVDMIREWVETERAIHAEIRAKNLHSEIDWRQNKKRCYLPYACAFRDVCTTPRDMDFRYRWLRDNTAEERWDFTRRQEEENDRA